MADNVLTLQRGTPPRSTRDLLTRLADEVGIITELDAVSFSTLKAGGLHLADPNSSRARCYAYPPYGKQFTPGRHSFREYSKSGGCTACISTLAPYGDHSSRAQAFRMLSRLADAHNAAALPAKFTVGALSSRRSRARRGMGAVRHDQSQPTAALAPEVYEAALTALRALEVELSLRLSSPEVDAAIRRGVCTEMLGNATSDSLAGLDDTPTIVGMSKSIWQAGRLSDLIRDRYTLDAESSVLMEVPRFIADYLLATTDFRWIRRSKGKYSVPQTSPAGYSPEELQLAGMMFDPDASSSMRSLRHALESARGALAPE